MTRRLKLSALPAGAAVAVLVATGVGGAHAGKPGAAAATSGRSGELDPGNFTTRIDNPWFPLKPGTKLTYKGVKDGEKQRDVFKVTAKTKVIQGVRCLIIADRVYAGGRLEERTRDYYVQDRRGAVWYFGEDTAELDRHGRVKSTEGTWHAGVDNARAGLFMPAHPRVGEHHRQEFYKGHAEDTFKVVSLHARIKVPYGRFRRTLKTKERTRLEPGVVDSKFYARGIGQVFEGSVKGPKERSALVAVKRP
jgi:hypothetical protein